MLSLPCCYLSTSGTPARCGSHDTIAIAEMALGLAQPSTKWCRWARIHTPAHTWRRSRVVVRAEATPPAAEPTATAASSDPRQPRRLSFCVNTHCQNQGSELVGQSHASHAPSIVPECELTIVSRAVQIAQFLGGLGVERLEVCGRECLGEHTPAALPCVLYCSNGRGTLSSPWKPNGVRNLPALCTLCCSPALPLHPTHPHCHLVRLPFRQLRQRAKCPPGGAWQQRPAAGAADQP